MMISAVTLGLAALGAASPLTMLRRGGSQGNNQPAPGTDYTATFDDLTPVLDGLVSLQQVGPYDGLDYQGINLISLGVSGAVIAGVRPESSPNVGAYDARADLLDGASPKITTQYPGSVTETFDLEKFYFGCVVATAEAVISAPISCSVRVQGYKASIAVADQTFEFNAPLLTLVEDMDEATLNDQFKDVDTVTFTTEYNGVPVVGNLVGATLIDSLSYKTYNTEDKDGNNNNGGNNNNNGGNNNNNVGNNSGDNNSGDKQEPWSSV